MCRWRRVCTVTDESRLAGDRSHRVSLETRPHRHRSIASRIPLAAPRNDTAAFRMRRVASLVRPACARALSGATTHFGFREVPVEDKARMVEGVFRRVAERCVRDRGDAAATT